MRFYSEERNQSECSIDERGLEFCRTLVLFWPHPHMWRSRQNPNNRIKRNISVRRKSEGVSIFFFYENTTRLHLTWWKTFVGCFVSPYTAEAAGIPYWLLFWTLQSLPMVFEALHTLPDCFQIVRMSDHRQWQTYHRGSQPTMSWEAVALRSLCHDFRPR
jgi:hypothetical protein